MPIIASAALAESIVLGIALAMDAMAVTLSNSLCEPDMPLSKKLGMPVAFALFQMTMPALGLHGRYAHHGLHRALCGHRLARHSRFCGRQDGR